MSKRTRGAIAAIAGGVLLLGTGGTFARWEASTGIPKVAVETGKLGVAKTTAEPTWSYLSGGNWTTVPAGETLLLNPGITVRGAVPVEMTVEGTTLEATLGASGSLVAATGSPQGLEEQFTLTWLFEDGNGVRELVSGPGSVVLTEKTTGDLIAQIHWDADKNTHGDGMDTSIWLENMVVTLTQRLPSDEPGAAAPAAAGGSSEPHISSATLFVWDGSDGGNVTVHEVPRL
ncbi:alternate-type signal peptide domain-containing protein [Xylanimonas ulmi]|uniref:Alternate signal-mediated exported protein n=1 Tax=Xylanimonas ulmi TaxID=228973 RepID=A0A4Q7M4Q2_9MICO|nr:alternate-type signal peptide domain-containing protein [Xylanibacterium ulmi]RZS61993.1 alternate signal-mediated exported protein [Xylanibacterium ulmi]